MKVDNNVVALGGQNSKLLQEWLLYEAELWQQISEAKENNCSPKTMVKNKAAALGAEFKMVQQLLLHKVEFLLQISVA